MTVSFVIVGLTARELYGKGKGRLALLLFAGSTGLLLCGHQLITDVAQLCGFTLALYGLALGLRRPHRGGLWLGTGTGLAFMSKGLLIPGCVGVLALLLPLLSARWRSREYLRVLAAAVLAGLPCLTIWPVMLYLRSPDLFSVWLWDNNFGRFLGWNSLGPASGPLDVVRTVAWSALLAWPLALVTVWSARRGLRLRPELCCRSLQSASFSRCCAFRARGATCTLCPCSHRSRCSPCRACSPSRRARRRSPRP